MPTLMSLPNGIGFEVSDLVQIVPKDVSRMEGRRVEEAMGATPYWTASYSSSILKKSQVPALDVWLMKAARPGNVFLAFDLERPRPRAHSSGVLSGVKAVGGDPFNGAANLAAITNSQQVTVDGLPADFQLSVGDYVSFKMSEFVRSLHMITDAAVADSSGTVVLGFLQGLDLQHFGVGAVVDFEKPAAVMSVKGNPRVPRGAGIRRVSFAAEEVFF